MSRANVTAAELAIHYGMTPRYWTRMAAEGKVPGAWQPSGGKGKWLFDRAAVERWHRTKLREVKQWPGYTSAARRTGAAPSVTASNIASPSAPRIDALLKSVSASG
jgi:hypothetical protein